MPINSSTRHGWFAIACGRGVEKRDESKMTARATDAIKAGKGYRDSKFVLIGWLFIRPGECIQDGTALL